MQKTHASIKLVFITLMLASQSCVAMHQEYSLMNSLKSATSQVSKKLYNFLTNTKTLATLAFLATAYLTYPSLVSFFTQQQKLQRPRQGVKRKQAATSKVAYASIELTEMQTLPTTHSGIIFDAQFSSNSQDIITAEQNNTARLYNVAKKDTITELFHDSPVLEAVFNLQTAMPKIATACQNGKGYIWKKPWLHSQRAELQHQEKTTTIAPLAFSANDNFVAGIINKTLYIWDSKTGKTKRIVKKKQPDFTTFAWHPTQNYLIAGHENGTIAEMRIDSTAQNILQSQNDELSITSLSFGIHTHKLVSADEKGTVCLWDLQSIPAKLSLSLKGHTARVNSAFLSPDAKETMILSASDDKTACIWDSKNGNRLYVLRGHNDLVRNARFNNDGSLALTNSADGRAGIWDTATGRHLRWINCLQARFSPDGNILLAIERKNGQYITKVWDITKIQQQ